MISNDKSIREALAFSELSEDEKKSRGILARLYGPCASIVDATRNGRRYTDELWENVFNKNEIVKEMFESGGIPMEMDHPQGREETDSTRIAAMLPEAPKRDKDGHLICYVDLIDTPCGKIAYQLAKYGFKLGISSRGSGDILSDDSVDPDTYDFTTFDLVLLPAVKDARLSMCESVNKNEIKFKNALRESYNDLKSEDEKTIMRETLKNLNIKLELDEELETVIVDDNYAVSCNSDNIGNNSEMSDNIDDEVENNGSQVLNEVETAKDESSEVIDDKSNDIVDSLNEALENLKNVIRQNSALENEIKDLKTEKSVRDAEVKKLNEDLDRYKDAFIRTSAIAATAKTAESNVKELTEKLQQRDTLLSQRNSEISKLKTSKNETLNENIANSNKKINALVEKLDAAKTEIDEQNQKLNKQTKIFKAKLSESIECAKKYKAQAENILTEYVNFRASMLGVKPSDILNKLDENYDIKNINKVCEQILTAGMPYNMPYGVTTAASKAKITESKSKNSLDDGYDELLELAGLK